MMDVGEMTNIALVGEYTNENGPFADDHFLVVVTEDGTWYDIPLSAESAPEVNKIEQEVGTPLPIGLRHNTTLTSRVIWPDDMRGRALFHFEKVKLTWRNIGQFIKDAGLIREYNLILTDEVRNFVERKRSGKHTETPDAAKT